MVNFRRYRQYFLCNVFSIVLFYCFAAIFTNQAFMDPKSVNSYISSNVWAPSLFVGIFLVTFIPYSYQQFMKLRKHEYGILMTMGMSEREVLVNMLLEQCVTAGISLLSGLFLGTLAAFVFYFVIQHGIGVTGLRWYFNPASYKWTALLYGLTILFTLVMSVLGFKKTDLIDLIKDKFRGEKNRKSKRGRFISGVVLAAVSVPMMILGYVYANSGLWFVISLIFMFAGSGLIIAQVESLDDFWTKVIPGFREGHFLGISFNRQHAKSQVRISIIAAWLLGFCIFFAGSCVVMYPALTKDAIRNSPYDLEYSQIFSKNQVTDSDIASLLAQNGVSVRTVKQVDYLRNGAFNLLPLSEVNEEFGCNYHIPEGKFLMVFQSDLQDGYKHYFSSPSTVGFDCGRDKMELKSVGSDVRILFNRNPTLADHTLVLNDTDYKTIAAVRTDYSKGIIKLYSFGNWQDSGKGIAAVQKYLLEKNRVDQSIQQRYYRATSRIESYTLAKQSAEFLLFVMLFAEILFCAASNIMIQFKIKAEAEKEQRILFGLYRLGVTAEEMLAMIRHKNIYYYMPQVITGLFIGSFYGYAVNEFYGFGWQAAVYSLIIGSGLTALQFVVVLRYSRRELLGFGFFQ
ncbi:ABC-type antimicrobial peptide transport system, permease component [Desulfosporosinus orientis DSM 765]|uniref:ABC-type antimicrobial peptide transport system, permease component n=2 Tax=Desulfosporosinus orientis TaxID=1563 RepID=G7WJ39_DESOD|nr:ABC-type antimicrobial peptide transport system, permease component [Desulfosporosinus orientis DSM 765]